MPQTFLLSLSEVQAMAQLWSMPLPNPFRLECTRDTYPVVWKVTIGDPDAPDTFIATGPRLGPVVEAIAAHLLARIEVDATQEGDR